MPVGFGAYRVSTQSKAHYDALLHAINEGCPLVDTSSNYTNGESEKLIGKVLKEAKFCPILVSKVGYIQGENLNIIEQLNQVGQATEDLVKINENLWHSIHPDFIRNQISLSLERLDVEKIDIYLLHNPEYYFYEEGATQEEYYRRIELAFRELETLVEEGHIGSYGISSNNFILNPSDPKITHIDKVYEAATNIKSEHNFKYIQFPFNMIEIDALENWYDGLSLLNKADGLGLKVMTNRPLNAFKDDQLIRLASYGETHTSYSAEEGQKAFVTAMMILDKKLKEQEPDETIYDLPLIKQFNDMWDSMRTPDAVEQVYFAHFFPMVARIWGADLTAQESTPFYNLFDISMSISRKNMSDVAKDFETQAISAGLIAEGADPIQVKLIDKYLSYPIEYVLVGMKEKVYVDQMKRFF
ncbi:aldo/keto reductase [Halobacteriovorax sp. HLS]|uniref:aldo/keto reductase n=1 Tax=Halobacteriovorax sp. HLS TaxID=2234000 RepID=UPI000FDA0CC5|nr:aldo/keto reductase [Halobacteriovorax sp. HLS]